MATGVAVIIEDLYRTHDPNCFNNLSRHVKFMPESILAMVAGMEQSCRQALE